MSTETLHPTPNDAMETEVTEREFLILQRTNGECIGCTELARATTRTPDGRLVIPAHKMDASMRSHLQVVREADALGEHETLLAAPPQKPEASAAPLNPLARAGITIRKTRTTPTRPDKQPRDVWEVIAPHKWNGMLNDLGGKKWRGLFSFWQDPTKMITRAIETTEPETYGDRVEAQNERSLARAERRHGYADKAAARAEASFRRADRISERFADGQPILIGHHSEARARRDQERMHAGMRRGVEETRLAALHEDSARGSERRVERQESLGYMQRRLEEAAAELRRIERSLAPEGVLYCPSCRVRINPRYDGPDREAEHKEHGLRPCSRDDDGFVPGPRTLAAIEEQQEKIAYWTKRIADAGGIQFSRADFAKGDLIMGSRTHGLGVVLRANAKTLSFAFLHPALTLADGTPNDSKLTYAEIKQHIPVADQTQEQREAAKAALDKIAAHRAAFRP